MTDLPEAPTKRLPRCPAAPPAPVGHLAVDKACHGQKLGGALLADAVVRARRVEVAVFALVIDAKDDAAEAFCLHYGIKHFRANSRQAHRFAQAVCAVLRNICPKFAMCA